ncbi:hypothetical protein BHM03_00036627, partial [Ensete ventricosum]
SASAFIVRHDFRVGSSTAHDVTVSGPSATANHSACARVALSCTHLLRRDDGHAQCVRAQDRYAHARFFFFLPFSPLRCTPSLAISIRNLIKNPPVRCLCRWSNKRGENPRFGPVYRLTRKRQLMDLSVVPYKGGSEEAVEAAGGGGGGGRYRECLRNHAAAMGGQSYDGCGEFMPGGEEGSLEALKCAACGCHRNFHRREGISVAGPRPPPLLLYGPGAPAAATAAAWDHSKLVQSPPPQFPAFLTSPLPLTYHAMQPPPLAAAPPPPCREGAQDRSCRVGSETPPRREEAAAEAAGSRKRFRTKFTAEQKEKMQAFAEKLGWRVQKQDDVALDEFCLQIGVKRRVLKVWMHNNKNHLSSSASDSVAVAVAAAAAEPSTCDPASAAAPIRV